MPRTFRLLFLVVAAAVIVLPVGTPSAQKSGSRLHLPKNKIPEDAKVILEQAEQFELLSLKHFYPPAGSSRDWRPPVGSDFYHYEILGRTEIRNAKTRENLVSAFEKGVAENNGDAAMCFNPRHGIHVSGHGKKVDFVMLDNREQMAHLMTELRTLQPCFAIFDVFNVLHAADENDNQEMRTVLRQLSLIQSNIGCGIQAVSELEPER